MEVKEYFKIKNKICKSELTCDNCVFNKSPIPRRDSEVKSYHHCTTFEMDFPDTAIEIIEEWKGMSK